MEGSGSVTLTNNPDPGGPNRIRNTGPTAAKKRGLLYLFMFYGDISPMSDPFP